MHEYSVVAELVSTLLPRLEQHNGQIMAIFLKKGELRILSDRALRNAFEIVAQGTRLEKATLDIEVVPATVSCPGCGYEGRAKYLEDKAFHFTVPVLTCPSCGGEVRLVSGRELYVDRVNLRTAADENAQP
jgi:hydrogenase nickel incorporation protein HypA/HybF